MKADKLAKLCMAGALCLNLIACTNVHARPTVTEQGTEQILSSEAGEELEDQMTEVLEPGEGTALEESELIIDHTPEISEAAVSENTAAEHTDTENTGSEKSAEKTTEPESESGTEEQMIPVEYTIEDQRLESGKTFDDIVVPEYAIAADGSEVTGEVEWLDPDSGMALDSEMELSGAEGESMVWEWTFVPDEAGYENAQGEVELTMYAAKHGVKNSIMDQVTDVRTESESGDKKQNSSASGSSIGASTIKEAESIRDVGKWMGSALTGLGVLGNSKDRGEYTTDRGNLTITHGTVKRETDQEKSAKQEMPQTEAGSKDAEKDTETEEEATFGNADNNPNVVQFPERKKASHKEIDAEAAVKSGWLFLAFFQNVLWK